MPEDLPPTVSGVTTPEFEFLDVAVDAPLFDPLTYKALPGKCQIGQTVEVPLGKRRVRGIVLGRKLPQDILFEHSKIKSIESVSDKFPHISERMLKWLKWVAQYYFYPLGQVIKLAYPPLDTETQRKSKRPPVVRELEKIAAPQLTQEQAVCVSSVLEKKGFHTHLIFGVTGSGKTEIYMRLIDEVLQSGKKAIFLVPEIALTPQLTERFVQRFGNQVAVLHSQLTDRERTSQWWEIVRGDRSILVGARSALFCPVDNLGMIIVDEEHEASYKQDEKLKYHGRDSAVMLGKIFDIPVILGSATPSLETWANAQEGKYILHVLKNRVYQQAFPQVEIVDMKLEKSNFSGLPPWLSEALYTKMQSALEQNLQVALLLNRRGLAQVVMCKSCGHTAKCPNCEISLTLHHGQHLVCHYCDYTDRFKEKCPQCLEGVQEPLGVGTEQVEKDLQKLFPEKKTARADRDEINSRVELEELIHQMEKGEIDILIGTQMIAKGLDFQKLYLVGFVLADVGFNLPDFRATERSFQLLTQMSGRAGRHLFENGKTGEVIIQAFNTEHRSLEFVLRHDFQGFSTQELLDRKDLQYPPFSKMICLRLQGPELNDVESSGEILGRRAEKLRERTGSFASIQVLGPAPAPLAKLRGNHRMQLLIKGESSSLLNAFVKSLLHDQTWLPTKVKILIDVDPLHLL